MSDLKIHCSVLSGEPWHRTITSIQGHRHSVIYHTDLSDKHSVTTVYPFSGLEPHLNDHVDISSLNRTQDQKSSVNIKLIIPRLH